VEVVALKILNLVHLEVLEVDVVMEIHHLALAHLDKVTLEQLQMDRHQVEELLAVEVGKVQLESQALLLDNVQMEAMAING
jgi:hypothetical protein